MPATAIKPRLGTIRGRVGKLTIFTCALLLVAFSCAGCVVVPRVVPSEEDDRCRLKTRKLTLGVSAERSAVYLPQCKDKECLVIIPAALLAIPVGSAIVSGSIMVGGNTIHWLEGQGRCEDSVTRAAMASFMETTRAAGGKAAESYQDLADWIEIKFPAQEEPPAKIEESGN